MSLVWGVLSPLPPDGPGLSCSIGLPPPTHTPHLQCLASLVALSRKCEARKRGLRGAAAPRRSRRRRALRPPRRGPRVLDMLGAPCDFWVIGRQRPAMRDSPRDPQWRTLGGAWMDPGISAAPTAPHLQLRAMAPYGSCGPLEHYGIIGLQRSAMRDSPGSPVEILWWGMDGPWYLCSPNCAAREPDTSMTLLCFGRRWRLLV